MEELQKKIEEQISFCELNLKCDPSDHLYHFYRGQINAFKILLSWLQH